MKQQKQRNAKLEKMIGKTYLYKARQRRIDGYRYDDGEVIIHTDGADIRIDENDLRDVLLRKRSRRRGELKKALLKKKRGRS